MVQFIGNPSPQAVSRMQARAAQRPYAFVLAYDVESLWQAQSIETLLKHLPEAFGARADMRLIVTECFSNAARHGQTDILGAFGRQRGAMFLLSFWHDPPMSKQVRGILDRGRSGWLPDYTDDGYMGANLGYPIMARLSRNITITSDQTELQFWFHSHETTSIAADKAIPV